MRLYNTLEELAKYFEMELEEFLQEWYTFTGTEQHEWRHTDLKTGQKTRAF